MDAVAETIERFGIMDHMPREYSMSLGAGETTPLRLTAAYAMLVNGGKRITPTLIDRVQDRNGKTIYRADERPCDGCSDVEWDDQPPPVIPDTREQIADPGSAYQIVTMMEGVMQRGTGDAVAAVGKPIAGKTGTTNDCRDAWFVGFTPDLAAGVFIGYDEPDSLGKRRDRRACRGADLPRIHDRGAEGRAGDRVPHPAGLRICAGQPATGLPRRRRRRRSTRPTSPAPSPARTAISAQRAGDRRGWVPAPGRRCNWRCGQGRCRERRSGPATAIRRAGAGPECRRRSPWAAPCRRRGRSRQRHRRPILAPPIRPKPRTERIMRAEIEAVADDIRKSLALLRRHL